MTVDRINAQMNELEKMKQQIQQPVQPTNLTQNFQISPTNRDVIKYASSLEEVNRDMVIGDTPFFSKDMSVMWFKKANGEIKPYELNEIIPKDNKDLQIEYLQTQIEELKGMIKNDANVTNVDTKQNATDTTGNDKAIRTEPKSTKSSSISKVSRSKKEQ
jgi:hypothetical protein